MSTREWTKAELDEVWPVPGWTWGHVSGRVWALYSDLESGQMVCMSVLGRMTLPTRGGIPPAAALLAVIGQHLGHDSPEFMARAMDEEAESSEERADPSGQGGFDTPDHEHGRALAWHEAAAMLRRGRVEP